MFIFIKDEAKVASTVGGVKRRVDVCVSWTLGFGLSAILLSITVEQDAFMQVGRWR